jgi:hypothetical protein
MTVDTTKKFTVVTQFITGSSGSLDSIKRYYVQGGKVIPNSDSTISGTSGNQIDTDFCTAQKTAFGDTDNFSAKGGLAQMSKALAQGMVLVMSVWDDVSFSFNASSPFRFFLFHIQALCSQTSCFFNPLSGDEDPSVMDPKLTRIANSTTPTCCGSTAAILSTRTLRNLVLDVVPATLRPVSPPTSSPSRPAIKSSTAISALGLSTRPSLPLK